VRHSDSDHASAAYAIRLRKGRLLMTPHDATVPLTRFSPATKQQPGGRPPFENLKATAADSDASVVMLALSLLQLLATGMPSVLIDVRHEWTAATLAERQPAQLR
jgi:hypothetical protein